MLVRILGNVLVALLLAGCATSAPAAPPTAAPFPSATRAGVTVMPVPSQTAIPVPYSKSLLLARWDGKEHRHFLLPVDPATGEPLPGYDPIDIQTNYSQSYSPDRKTLAVVSYPGDSPTNPLLHLIDLSTWQERTFPLDATGWALTGMSFNADGSRMATAFSDRISSLLVFDVKHGVVSAQVQTDFLITRLQFTANGKALMAYGQPVVERYTEDEHSQGPARVALLDAGSLKVRWSRELPGVLDGVYPSEGGDGGSIHTPGNGFYVNPAVVFAPSEDVLYIVHGDEDKLTVVNFDRRAFRTMTFHPELTWFERILMVGARTAYAKVAAGKARAAAISSDGELIYAVGVDNQLKESGSGEWQIHSVPLNLQAVRTRDAAVVFEQEVFASSLALAPDGSRLFLQSWKENAFYGDPSTEIFDLGKGEFTNHYEGVYLSPARRMDGSLLLASAAPYSNSSQRTRMSIYDFETAELIAEWTSATYANWITPP